MFSLNMSYLGGRQCPNIIKHRFRLNHTCGVLRFVNLSSSMALRYQWRQKNVATCLGQIFGTPRLNSCGPWPHLHRCEIPYYGCKISARSSISACFFSFFRVLIYNMAKLADRKHVLHHAVDAIHHVPNCLRILNVDRTQGSRQLDESWIVCHVL